MQSFGMVRPPDILLWVETNKRTAQELSLAQDTEYERNTQLETEGEEAPSNTPKPKQR